MKRIAQQIIEQYQIEVVDQDTYVTLPNNQVRRVEESKGLTAIKNAHRKFLEERIEWAKLAKNA